MSFELTDEEAEALSLAYHVPDRYIHEPSITLAAAAERWRELHAPIKVGDIVHYTGSPNTWAARMEVVHVHDDRAWAVDADGDHGIHPLSSLAKGARP